MEKGKGSVSYWVISLQSGFLLYEMDDMLFLSDSKCCRLRAKVACRHESNLNAKVREGPEHLLLFVVAVVVAVCEKILVQDPYHIAVGYAAFYVLFLSVSLHICLWLMFVSLGSMT